MYHSDPTANTAMGAVNREWKQTVKLAIRMHNDQVLSDREQHRFLGIFKQLLSEPSNKLRLYE